MNRQVLSRKRVIDHGEVFTPPKLVNDMLDLVAHECERVDSRFLEPACSRRPPSWSPAVRRTRHLHLVNRGEPVR